MFALNFTNTEIKIMLKESESLIKKKLETIWFSVMDVKLVFIFIVMVFKPHMKLTTDMECSFVINVKKIKIIFNVVYVYRHQIKSKNLEF